MIQGELSCRGKGDQWWGKRKWRKAEWRIFGAAIFEGETLTLNKGAG